MSKLLTLSICFVFLFSVHCQIKPHPGVAVGEKVPGPFKLQLDLAPEERWREIILAYKEPFMNFYNFLNSYLDLIPQSNLVFTLFGNWIKDSYPYKEMVEEVQGIAKVLHLNFGKVMFLQFTYEFSVACSGIVVRNQENQILHGRNLDFPGMDYLSKLMAVVDVYVGEKKICTIDQVVGSVFFLTGIKKDIFAINEDTRFIRMDGQTILNVLYNIFVLQYEPSAWLLRRVILTENSFDSAVKTLSQATISAPIYFIISGTKPFEGTVIEKKVQGVHATYSLNETTWFLVQTNYDRDIPDPDSDKRRCPVEEKIQKIGPSITIQQLFTQVMSQYPSLNIETIFTMTAIAQTGYHNATAWYGIGIQQQNQNNLQIE